MKRYNTEEVERALHVLALEAGNSRKASEETGIPEQTLRQWRNDIHRDRYEQIRTEHEQRLDLDFSERMLNVVGERLNAADATLVEYMQALNRGDHAAAKDLAGADRNLLTSLGISNQNSRIIREKPTQVIETRSAEDAWQALAQLGVVVEGTATEIQPEPEQLTEGPTGQATERETASATHAREEASSSTA